DPGRRHVATRNDVDDAATREDERRVVLLVVRAAAPRGDVAGRDMAELRTKAAVISRFVANNSEELTANVEREVRLAPPAGKDRAPLPRERRPIVTVRGREKLDLDRFASKPVQVFSARVTDHRGTSTDHARAPGDEARATNGLKRLERTVGAA